MRQSRSDFKDIQILRQYSKRSASRRGSDVSLFSKKSRKKLIAKAKETVNVK